MNKNLYYMGKYKSKILSLLVNSKDVVDLINPIIKPGYEQYFSIDDILLGGTYEITKSNGSEKMEIQGHLFDYLFVPDTTTEEKVFVCTEVLVDDIADNIFNNFIMYIHVFASKSLIRLDSFSTPKSIDMKKRGFTGNRIDMLCDAIDRTLNGNTSFGIGDVSLIPRNPISLYLPNDKYYGKVLKYSVKNYIDTENCDI